MSRPVIPATFAVLVGMGSVSAFADVSLNATGSDGKITLSWSTTDNLRGIQVYRDTDANPSGRQRVAILPGNARSYTDTSVTNGRQYWYWIKYTDTAGAVSNSNAGSATAGASNPPPQPPGNDGNSGADCASATLPLEINGAGEHCRVTTGSISHINSWNTERVEINGVAYTNKWSSQMPAKVDGKYSIRYVGKHSWSHLEVNGSGAGDNDPGTQPIAVTGVTVVPANPSVKVGATVSLTASVAPGNASNKSVTWNTSNAGVAKVSANGVVTGAAAGSATITAKTADGGHTASSTVTVSAAENPAVNYTLQVSVSGKGTTSISTGGHSYRAGTVVTITATPAQGSAFSGWSGAFTGNSNPLTLTMDGNKSLTAMFMEKNNGNDGNAKGEPPHQTVRVFWVHPADVPSDKVHPDGIAMVMKEAQRYYKQELGRTFTLNDPVVEVVAGERVRSYYENTPQWGEKYWYSVANMQIELLRRLKLGNPDDRWLLVGEISAEGDGAGGGASVGWVMLSQHDADGAAGIGGDMNRWYGGMVHEIGHALGLPDSTYTDGTPMSASFYGYPNTHFSQEQKDRILNGRYGGFLH